MLSAAYEAALVDGGVGSSDAGVALVDGEVQPEPTTNPPALVTGDVGTEAPSTGLGGSTDATSGQAALLAVDELSQQSDQAR
jgi:hypothetical protein